MSIRQEKLKAKEVTDKATKAELKELDKQYVQAYEALKKKCTIEESDDQWYQWGKIRRWGSFLNMVTGSRKSLNSRGIRSTSSITPEILYADMNSLLSVYLTYHPEAKEYVGPAKAFYKEVSRGKREYAGVVVFAFKDEAKHSVLKVGDIITGYAGNAIKTYDDLKSAHKNHGNAKANFVRLDRGEFTEMSFDWEETGIVGLLDSTE